MRNKEFSFKLFNLFNFNSIRDISVPNNSPIELNSTAKEASDSFVRQTDLSEDIEMAIKAAAIRRPVSFGKTYSNSPLWFIVEPLNFRRSNEKSFPLSTLDMMPADVISLSIALRNMVEWPIWSQQTSFPYVKESASAGDSLGQCLVTSRFAKNYFLDAKLVEVKVKNKDGQIVGPHVVLEIPMKGLQGKIVSCYLDLTHDQSLALGEIPRVAKDYEQERKINLSVKDSPDCPYIFIRYQTDQDLKDKKSKPLEHSSLVMEMVAYRYGHDMIQGLERYAKDLGNGNTNISEIYDLFGRDIGDRIVRANEYIEQKTENQSYTPLIQLGIITKNNYMPSPEWLWEVSGLKGFSEAIVFNEGYIQEQLFFSGRDILILNLRGRFTPKQIEKVTSIIRPDSEKFRPLFSLSILEKYMAARDITGPVFVKPD